MRRSEGNEKLGMYKSRRREFEELKIWERRGAEAMSESGGVNKEHLIPLAIPHPLQLQTGSSANQG